MNRVILVFCALSIVIYSSPEHHHFETIKKLRCVGGNFDQNGGSETESPTLSPRCRSIEVDEDYELLLKQSRDSESPSRHRRFKNSVSPRLSKSPRPCLSRRKHSRKTGSQQGKEAHAKSFEDAAQFFQGFVKLDEYGRTGLDYIYAMRSAIEFAKRYPNAAIGVAEAFVNNIDAKSTKTWIPQMTVDYPSLAIALGAYTLESSTMIGQLVQTLPIKFRGLTAKPTSPVVRTNQGSSSVRGGSSAKSSATRFARSLPGLGWFFSKQDDKKSEHIGMGKAFVHAALSHFNYLKQDESGKTSFDLNHAMRTGVKMMKHHPDLAIMAAEALADNMTVKTDEAGNPLFHINFPGLASALGKGCVTVATHRKLHESVAAWSLEHIHMLFHSSPPSG